MVGRKFICNWTVFTLSYFVFEANLGACILGGNLMQGFLCYKFEGLIHGVAYFRNFTASQANMSIHAVPMSFRFQNLQHTVVQNNSTF